MTKNLELDYENAKSRHYWVCREIANFVLAGLKIDDELMSRESVARTAMDDALNAWRTSLGMENFNNNKI